MTEQPEKPTTPPTPGELLSAMERGVTDHRYRIERTFGNGHRRSSDQVDGFRSGWQAALAYLKLHGWQR